MYMHTRGDPPRRAGSALAPRMLAKQGCMQVEAVNTTQYCKGVIKTISRFNEKKRKHWHQIQRTSNKFDGGPHLELGRLRLKICSLNLTSRLLRRHGQHIQTYIYTTELAVPPPPRR